MFLSLNGVSIQTLELRICFISFVENVCRRIWLAEAVLTVKPSAKSDWLSIRKGPSSIQINVLKHVPVLASLLLNSNSKRDRQVPRERSSYDNGRGKTGQAQLPERVSNLCLHLLTSQWPKQVTRKPNIMRWWGGRVSNSYSAIEVEIGEAGSRT